MIKEWIYEQCRTQQCSGGWSPAIMTNKPREKPCVVWFGDGAGGEGEMDLWQDYRSTSFLSLKGRVGVGSPQKCKANKFQK